ncbi:MAG: peptidyl-tRNA hydrolase [Clostridiales bacterium]|nr:peptidyl-tRNA hydrolase [Clostridiales bacterium]
MRQLIIARKDLKMSPGKLAAQCGHAAMAFLTWPMRGGDGVRKTENGYAVEVRLDRETYEEWICGSFVKTVCEARNCNQLMKAVDKAKSLGLKEGEDYF